MLFSLSPFFFFFALLQCKACISDDRYLGADWVLCKKKWHTLLSMTHLAVDFQVYFIYMSTDTPFSYFLLLHAATFF